MTRFKIIRRLGAGGMGIVYEAWDDERDERVALKTMRSFDPSALFRFKLEFRALADIVHPNLVALHELMSIEDHWFFTMELVQGVDLLHYVRVDGKLDYDRLRGAARQLTEGLRALHRVGKLHRDIKPSNVLVADDGRVVILDFGLVTDVDPHALMADDSVVGTAAYMAPEQTGSGPISEASDWYGMGALLYEALTRQVPFQGELQAALANTAAMLRSPPATNGSQDDTIAANTSEPPLIARTEAGRLSPFALMLVKQSRDPAPPSRFAPGVPADLEQLCLEMLRRDPTDRPDGDEILRRLGGARIIGAIEAGLVPPPDEATLIGRSTHLHQLAEALAACGLNHPVTVYVHGVAGMGKSALIHRFLDDLHTRGDVLVLPGRCYERESVPYKALDSVIDALSQHLRRLRHIEAAALLPREMWALATLFPVLRRVEAVEALQRNAEEGYEPHHVRASAVQALRLLLTRLAARRHVVLFIDDMQWGDTDSARVLIELLAAPAPPPVLLLGSYRTDERDGSPLLRELRSAEALRHEGEIREVVVGALTGAESLALTRALLVDDDAITHAVIARESEGNPYFIAEMTRHRQSGADGVRSGEVKLEQVVLARVASLPLPERELLEILAVAGRPIAQGVAFRAGKMGRRGRPALAGLRAAHLVRSLGARSEDAVETYHDRIREILVEHLTSDRLTVCHHALAVTLAAEAAEPDMLAVHFRGAGDLQRAAHYAEAAAERAFAALAFGRAVEMYRLTLDLRPADVPGRRNLLRRLAASLANAGRSVESAEVYLQAADGAPTVLALELRRSAAEKFLVSGHVDRGQDLLRSVLAAVDMSLPTTPLRALMSLMYHRLRIQLRGLRFHERQATEIPLETLTRIDTCWAAALGMAMVDNVRGADFQARHLLLALTAGEPYRVARALAMEVGYSASAGSPAHRRTARLRTEALALAARIGHPHALGVATMTAGLSYYFEGGWKRGFELFERAERILRRQCTGVRPEIINDLLYSLRCQVYLGRLRDVCTRLPSLIAEAEERADLYASTYFRLRYAYLTDLAEDAASRAIVHVENALSNWSHRGYHVQHYLELFARGEIALYASGGAAAWEQIAAWLVQVRRSHVFRVQHFRIESEHLRGRAALAAATTDRRVRRKRLDEASREARNLRSEGVPWALALAAQLAGGVAWLRGERQEACDAYRTAAGLFEAADMLLYGMASRRRLGELLGGAAGSHQIAVADAFMHDQGIANPRRWTVMYCGFPVDDE